MSPLLLTAFVGRVDLCPVAGALLLSPLNRASLWPKVPTSVRRLQQNLTFGFQESTVLLWGRRDGVVGGTGAHFASDWVKLNYAC
jgi:hypothetical protein